MRFISGSQRHGMDLSGHFFSSLVARFNRPSPGSCFLVATVQVTFVVGASSCLSITLLPEPVNLWRSAFIFPFSIFSFRSDTLAWQARGAGCTSGPGILFVWHCPLATYIWLIWGLPFGLITSLPFDAGIWLIRGFPFVAGTWLIRDLPFATDVWFIRVFPFATGVWLTRCLLFATGVWLTQVATGVWFTWALSFATGSWFISGLLLVVQLWSVGIWIAAGLLLRDLIAPIIPWLMAQEVCK